MNKLAAVLCLLMFWVLVLAGIRVLTIERGAHGVPPTPTPTPFSGVVVHMNDGSNVDLYEKGMHIRHFSSIREAVQYIKRRPDFQPEARPEELQGITIYAPMRNLGVSVYGNRITNARMVNGRWIPAPTPTWEPDLQELVARMKATCTVEAAKRRATQTIRTPEEMRPTYTPGPIERTLAEINYLLLRPYPKHD
jgi:hypothetical protein